MGPNVYAARAGALLVVAIENDPHAHELFTQLLVACEFQIRALMTALQWPTPMVVAQRDGLQASIFASAPIDALMTATEVNEQAWMSAEATVRGETGAVDLVRLQSLYDVEHAAQPNAAAVYVAALSRNVTVTFDDETLSVGSGEGSYAWPLALVPEVAGVPWHAVRDVPVALVTGSNGKTTTTRLVVAMWRAAGRVVGFCCSDGVWIDDLPLDSGDYSGPTGARMVLRDTRVQAAVLETARGGILRRGLAIHRATAAVITNIAADHFGEYGVHTLHDLADAKRVVATALNDDGRMVLNADDSILARLGARLSVPCAWFSVADTHEALDVHVAGGGDAAIVHDGNAWLHVAQSWHDLGAIAAMPLSFGGAAAYNVANILGASLLAAVMGVPINAITLTLGTFGTTPLDNPGRLQRMQFGGVTVIIDYAHNPDGLTSLCRAAATVPATRRLLVLGQAGDRDDAQLRALVRAAWSVTPFDRVIVKEMPAMLRGRSLGDLPAVFLDELRGLGVPDARVGVAPSELEAVRQALDWARDGDVLVCPVHIDKTFVFALLERMREARWRAGDVLPA